MLASEIIKKKLICSGGKVTLPSYNKNPYTVSISSDGNSFSCPAIPDRIIWYFSIFDIVVNQLNNQGGKAKKGNAQKDRVGFGKCSDDTVAYAIGKYYFKKNIGESSYNPICVISAILDWAGVAYNRRGYLELNP